MAHDLQFAQLFTEVLGQCVGLGTGRLRILVLVLCSLLWLLLHWLFFDLFLRLCHSLSHRILSNVDLGLDPQRKVDPLVDIKEDSEGQKERTDGDDDGPKARVRLISQPGRPQDATLVYKEKDET